MNSAPEVKPAPQPRLGRRILKAAVPAFIYGAGDDDPASIGTFSQTGAQSGTGLLWLLLISTPMLQVIQLTCAKLGVITKKGLSTLLKEQYGIRVAATVAVLIGIANVATIGADIAGMSEGFSLLTGASWKWFVLPLTLAIWYFQVYRDYASIRKVFAFFGCLLIAYIIAGVLAHPNWGRVLHDTFIPHIELNIGFVTAAVGVLGATLSPYMFYFQAAEEVESGRRASKIGEVELHTTLGMIFSNIISYFIILSTATMAMKSGHAQNIETAADAARALEPVAGHLAKYLFATGIIGAGLLAVPVLAASTATMFGEVAGWRVGMARAPHRARGYYLTVTIALLIGVLITLSGIKPIKALFYSQILSGMVAPVLIYLVFRLSSRRDLLGDHVNSKWQQAWGWLSFTVLTTAVALMVYGWIKK